MTTHLVNSLDVEAVNVRHADMSSCGRREGETKVVHKQGRNPGLEWRYLKAGGNMTLNHSNIRNIVAITTRVPALQAMLFQA